MPVPEQIRSKLSQLPHKPGVYLMKDRFGTVIYVGKARDLRKRVSQYFHPSRRMGWDLKFNALVEAIHDFDIHIVRSEPEAVLLEGKLLKRLQTLSLRASEGLHRAVHWQRDTRTIPDAGAGGVRFPRRPIPGDEGTTGSGDAEGRRRARLREGGAVARHVV